MATAQHIIDQARLPLVDAAKTRYTDPQALAYLNFGLMFLRGKRPDLFIGSLSGDMAALELAGTIPLEQQFHQALADYVTARAETHDDEDAMNARAKDFFSLAAGVL
jgi:hypothetical protein